MTTPLSTLGLAALTYSQEWAWPVFPVERRGKRPLIRGGFRNASTHPEQVCTWWDRWPGANIGFCPGSVDLLVIDVDGPSGERLAREVGVGDAPTLQCLTSRGRHIYFRLPQGVTIANQKLLELDIRASNGNST